MPRFFLALLILFKCSNLWAVDFQNENLSAEIGSILSIKGDVVLGRSKGKLVDYPIVGQKIYDNLYISVRENSEITLQILNGGLLVLKANTRIFLSKINRFGRIPIVLFDGNLGYKDQIRRSSIEVRLGNSGVRYWGNAFAIKLRGLDKEIVKEEGSFLAKSGGFDSEVVAIEKSQLVQVESTKQEEKKEQTESNAKSNTSQPASNTQNQASSLSDLDDIFGDQNQSKTQGPSALVTTSDVANEFDDIFGGPSETKEEAPKGIQRPETKKSHELDLFFRNSLYWQSPPENSRQDDQFDHIDLRLNGKMKWTGHNNSVETTYKVDITNREHVYRKFEDALDLRNDKKFPLELVELYYLESSKNFDLTVGKKIVKTGKGMIYSPSDKISPRDQIVPVAPYVSGAFITQADFYDNKNTYSIILVPYFVGTRSPTSLSRWSLQNDGTVLEFETELPEKFYKKIQTMLKFETTLKGWDLFAAIFNGPNPDPVIRKDITVVNNRPDFKLYKEHAYTSFISGGFSTVFGGLELHGEMLKSNTEDGKDDNYTQGMVGFRYTLDESVKFLGLDSIDIISEYAKETIQQEQSRPFFAVSSINSRVYRDTLLGTFILKFNDRFSINFDYQFDRADNGSANIVGFNWRKKEGGEWRLKLEMFSGDDDSLFGKWDKNDNLALEYFFNF